MAGSFPDSWREATDAQRPDEAAPPDADSAGARQHGMRAQPGAADCLRVAPAAVQPRVAS